MKKILQHVQQIIQLNFGKKNEENLFILKEKIEKAYSVVVKILYKNNGNLISGTVDDAIKIWKEVNDKHQYLTTLIHKGGIRSA